MLEKMQSVSRSSFLIGRRIPLTAVQAALHRWAIVDEGDRVLDMDCRDGALLCRLLENIHFEPCGIAETYMDMMETRRCLPNADIMNCPSEDIAWRAEAFDVILCGRAPAETRNLKDTLTEVHRTLKSGGQFVWAFPSFITSLLTGTLSVWNRERVTALITECGFEQIEWHGLFTRPVVIAFKARS